MKNHVKNQLRCLITTCALAGATTLPAMAQSNSTGGTMQGNTGSGTMQSGTMNNGAMNNGTMNNGTMNNGTMNNGTMNNGMMGNQMSGGMSNGTMGGGMLMMDETTRAYVSADQAGRGQMLAPMSLRQQVEFLTRLYQMQITGPTMMNMGLVNSNKADANNMAGATMGGMGTTGGMSNGIMQGSTQNN